MIARSSVTKWDIYRFLLLRVPMVLWTGVKVLKLDHEQCVTQLKRTWRNRNPYNGTYFAGILAAAEMASGLMVFDEMRCAEDVAGIRMAARISSIEATFHRQITDSAVFTCLDGKAIERAVIKAVSSGKRGEHIYTRTRAFNPQGKLCASINLVWTVYRV